MVEDEEDILDLLLTILSDHRIQVDGESHDVRVSVARNGKEALDLLSKNWYDAVLSDIHMPVMDGLDLLANLRGLGKEIPFIFLTGFGDKVHAVRALRLGCFDFLDKPFNNDRLRSVVHRAAVLGYRGRALEQKLTLKLGPFAHLPEEQFRQLRLLFRSIILVEELANERETEVVSEASASLKSLLAPPKAKSRSSVKKKAS